MPETILLALLFAKIKGYEIKTLFKSWTIYPVIIFEMINLIGQVFIFLEHYEFIGFIKSLNPFYFSAYLLLVFNYDIYINSIIGAIFMFFGGVLNDVAIRANGGFMPVYPTLSYLTGYARPEAFDLVKDIHILGNSQAKLKILTDFIDLGYSVLSIGDVFIRMFVFIIIYSSIKKINNQRGKENVTVNSI
jgi:hypothetical protein